MTVDMKDPFISMLVHAFIGAFVGSIGGLVMVYFIALVGYLISGTAAATVDSNDAVWPAMAMGSIVGTILGGVAGLRKTK
jgi:ABC-type transport system involved in cytochrome bd biosynthesis fused ATPase/permease subunit